VQKLHTFDERYKTCCLLQLFRPPYLPKEWMVRPYNTCMAAFVSTSSSIRSPFRVLSLHVRGSTHVYDSRNTQRISRVARCRALQHSALQVWMLWHVPILHRRVHTARAAERTHIDASMEVADADVAPIWKFSRRKYIPNDRDRDLADGPGVGSADTRAVKAYWCRWMRDLEGRKLTCSLGMPVEALLPAWWGNKVGVGVLTPS
jgi:hypothetical protein